MKVSKKEQKAVDKWNAAYPIGTSVTLAKDDGTILPTKTRSEAWVLSGHSAVIMVDGVSGCYLLDRVKAVKHGN